MPLKTLLWKEYRQNRAIVFTALALIALPYLIFIGGFCLGVYLWGIVFLHRDLGVRWGDFTAISCFYSLGLSQLGMALIGGVLIAGERADRSIEFLAGLPIPRGKSFLAKMLLAAILVAAIWLPNSTILWITFEKIRYHEFPYLVLASLGIIATIGLTLFSTAWFFSSTTKSPTLAVCGGLITPLLCYALLLMILFIGIQLDPSFLAFWEQHKPQSASWYLSPGVWYCMICLVMSISCFTAGTWSYLRRTEP